MGGIGVALFFLTFALHLTSLFSGNTLLQGSNFRLGDSLISPHSLCKLDFFSFPNAIGKSYLGITFGENRIWIANPNNPVNDDSGPRLIIDDYGNLKIMYSGDSNSIELYSYGAPHPVNAHATLHDDGNFKLQQTFANGSVKVLWESHNTPRNILLPRSKLGFNWRTRHVWNLTSRVGPKTPVLGSFTIGMDPHDTKQLVIWWKGNIFWKSGPLNEQGRFPNLRLSSTKKDHYFAYISNENETSFVYVASSAHEDPIVLDSQGQLTGGASVSCNARVTVSGCVPPLKPPKCRNPDSYLSLGDFNFKHGYMSSVGYKSDGMEMIALYDCGAMCFNSCSCSFFSPTTEDDTGCEMWDKGAEFTASLSGRPIYFIRDNPTNTTNIVEEKSKAKRYQVTWIASVTGGALVILTSIFYACHLYRRKERSDQKMLLSEIRGFEIPSSVNGEVGKFNKNVLTRHEMHIFSFESLDVATNNFSSTNKLGEGGFGPVYKGELPDGQEIAIKRLSRNSRQGLTEFENEIELIGKLQHPNFVRLRGFCIEKEERMLIYEYLPNKSLDFYLFDSNYIILLDWEKRLNIIQGIAQGLLYLHKSSNLGVVHRDLKPSNILLDNEMKPKISDFGIARIIGLKEYEEITNRVIGTFGYMPPEYVSKGVISTRTDVFSFGVLILEIVSGKKNCNFHEYPHNLIGYAWMLWNEDKALQLIDPILNGTYTVNEMLKYVHIGLLCVQDKAKDRPNMRDVVSFLSNETAVLAEPKISSNIIVKDTKLPDNGEEYYSCNDVTTSPQDGR